MSLPPIQAPLLIKFNKSFKSPDAISEKGIQQAIKLMQEGRLYRYNFSEDLHNHNSLYALKDESEQLATEISKLEYEFALYTKHPYIVAVNSCGSAMFLALKAIGVQYGDKVFTNAFTFTTVPSSIVSFMQEEFLLI